MEGRDGGEGWRGGREGRDSLHPRVAVDRMCTSLLRNATVSLAPGTGSPSAVHRTPETS